MKKFTLLVLGAAVFFTGLGGIAKHFKNYFLRGAQEDVVSFDRAASDEEIRFSEHPEKPRQFVVISKMKKQDNHNFNIEIEPTLSSEEPEKTFEFQRQPSRVQLQEGIELPREEMEKQQSDVLIPSTEPLKIQKRTSQIKVFVDRDKKPE